MKVKVASANAFFYPDVFVSCEAREQANSLYKEQPFFIAEVLSPSTEAFDRGKKFAYYRQLDSLQHYWLIDSQSMAIDCFSRGNDGNWILHAANSPEQILTLDKLATRFRASLKIVTDLA